MHKFRTMFYNRASGAEFTVSWADEQQYLQGKAFLDALTGGSFTGGQPDKSDYYVLESDAQRDAMLEFRRKLREG